MWGSSDRLYVLAVAFGFASIVAAIEVLCFWAAS